MSRSADEDPIAERLTKLVEAHTIEVLEKLDGVRSDVATLALITAAYIGIRHSLEINGFPASDVEAMVADVFASALRAAKGLSATMVAEGNVTFHAVDFVRRGDAEMRLLDEIDGET